MTDTASKGSPSEVVQILRPDHTLDPNLDPKLSRTEILTLYRALVQTRLLDERLVQLQRQGRIGFHIGSVGEEATVLGSAFALRKQDFLFPSYREFGAALLRGMPLQRYLDNMFGNASDLAKGRQMPDHITCRACNFGSVSSPIGTQITQAVGYAWAAKLRREDAATLVYFGEGSTSSSEFHNGANFAGVFGVPVVLLCRNNGWAISVPSDRQSASESYAHKGLAYGLHAVRVDGNDLFAVVAATREAIARASRGEGPTLLEALTYRMAGHSTSDDPSAYRAKDLLDPWRKRDPLERVRQYLIAQGWWEERDQVELEAQFEAALKAGIALAEQAPAPTLESLFTDVYEGLPWHLREQYELASRGARPPKHF